MTLGLLAKSWLANVLSPTGHSPQACSREVPGARGGPQSRGRTPFSPPGDMCLQRVTPRWQGGQLLGGAARGNLSRGAGPTKQFTTLAGRERVDDEVHQFLFVCVNMLRTP